MRTRQQNTEYHRQYRAKNREKLRRYQREYMQVWRKRRR